MALVLDVLSWISISIGLFFMLVGTFGVLRLPGIFTRLHAAGMTDTMGAASIILGLCFQTDFGLVLARLVILYAFLVFTSPIAGHALARAALAGGEPTGLEAKEARR